MSKWKTIRKENLRGFKNYARLQGWLVGVGTSFLGVALTYWSSEAFLIAGVILVAATFHDHHHSDSFTSIRKAIEDARGENQQ